MLHYLPGPSASPRRANPPYAFVYTIALFTATTLELTNTVVRPKDIPTHFETILASSDFVFACVEDYPGDLHLMDNGLPNRDKRVIPSWEADTYTSSVRQREASSNMKISDPLWFPSTRSTSGSFEDRAKVQIDCERM